MTSFTVEVYFVFKEETRYALGSEEYDGAANQARWPTIYGGKYTHTLIRETHHE